MHIAKKSQKRLETIIKLYNKDVQETSENLESIINIKIQFNEVLELIKKLKESSINLEK